MDIHSIRVIGIFSFYMWLSIKIKTSYEMGLSDFPHP